MKVELFTLAWCPFCVRARALLDRYHVTYEEIPVDRDPARRSEARARSGRQTLPQLFVDGRHVGDCEEMLALDRAGRLREILGL
jgi:glutaredoxin 3